MLYVFHGNNRRKVVDQVYTLTNSLLKKRADAQLFTYEGEEISSQAVDELIEAQGLFAERYIVLLREPMKDVVSREVVFQRLGKIQKSKNIFILLETTLHASHKKKLTQHAEKTEEYNENKNKEAFNVFSLSDELGARNKRKLWMLYRQALREGVDAESIHGTLHWAVRGMLFAFRSDSAVQSGQKPFVYGKFKRYAGNFGLEKLKKISRELIILYHDARRGKHDLKIALEHWILSL